MRFRGGAVNISGSTPGDLISYVIQPIVVQVVKNVALPPFVR